VGLLKAKTEIPDNDIRRLSPVVWLRRILAIASLGVTVWVVVTAIHAFRVTPDQIRVVKYDEYTAKTVDFVLGDTERFLQVGVIVLGGLWTLGVIDKDRRIGWIDKPELIMFILASLLLVASFYLDQRLSRIVKQVYWDVGKLSDSNSPREIADFVDSPYINLHYQVLVRCFYSGLVVSALAALSIARLRKSP
jgi:hypothetical protein